jgi:hypothetical protein
VVADLTDIEAISWSTARVAAAFVSPGIERCVGPAGVSEARP